MALHHESLFFGAYVGAVTYNGIPFPDPNLPYWLTGLFLHVAAPAFWFLGGISIALFVDHRRQRSWTQWQITRYFLIRAGLIVILDLTLGSLLWSDALGNTHVLLSLAASIAIVSVLRLLPMRILVIIFLPGTLIYQWWIGSAFAQLDTQQTLLRAFFLTNQFEHFPSLEFPLLGWLGVMVFGFLMGSQKFVTEGRIRPWLTAGIVLFLVWLGLRLNGNYADLAPYDPETPWYHFLFLSKSPPSLTYQTFYLGLNAILIALLLRFQHYLLHQPITWIIFIGQVPLFFYLLHPLVSCLAAMLFPDYLILPRLVKIFLAWICMMIVMISLSYLYRRLKNRYPNSILQYI
jgi:hypothetical protein